MGAALHLFFFFFFRLRIAGSPHASIQFTLEIPVETNDGVRGIKKTRGDRRSKDGDEMRRDDIGGRLFSHRMDSDGVGVFFLSFW